MNKGFLKSLFLSGALSLAAANTNAKSDNVINFNDHANGKTEITTEPEYEVLLAPKIVEGGAATAGRLSRKHNTIALHLEGGTEGLPEKVANIIGPAFADRKYTDKPLNIVVVYGDAGGEATAAIYFPREIDTQAVVKMSELGKSIDTINEAFVAEYGSDQVLPEVITTASINTPGR